MSAMNSRFALYIIVVPLSLCVGDDLIGKWPIKKTPLPFP